MTSAFTLSGTVGRLDDAANPRRGAIVRPAVQITIPPSSTSHYRLDVSANGYVPVSRSAVLATRVRIGRLFPFGKSVPGEADDPTVKFLQLRDVAFTAGGTGDVRGWEDRLLGPKAPDIRFTSEGDSLIPSSVEGYVPYGAFTRATFSLELRVPVPGMPKLGSIVFLDGGRVWTNDARFEMQGDPYGQEQLFFATGAGVHMRTPVGPIEFSVGYKLNPSVVDLVEAEDLVDAILAGEDVDSMPRKNSRRWQFHLAIGTTY
jgi:outer membrane protein assembly factor BamA